MKIKINFNHKYTEGEKWGSVTITKGKYDSNYYSASALLHDIKVKLNKLGLDLIKKSPVNDGHMFGDSYLYYLRDRKWRFCVVDMDYCIRSTHEDYNTNGEIVLTLVVWEPEKIKGLFNKKIFK